MGQKKPLAPEQNCSNLIDTLGWKPPLQLLFTCFPCPQAQLLKSDWYIRPTNPTGSYVDGALAQSQTAVRDQYYRWIDEVGAAATPTLCLPSSSAESINRWIDEVGKAHWQL